MNKQLSTVCSDMWVVKDARRTLRGTLKSSHLELAGVIASSDKLKVSAKGANMIG